MLELYNTLDQYDLPAMEKYTLLALSRYADKVTGKNARPGYVLLAEYMSVDIRSVRRLLAQLEQKQIIHADYRPRGGRGNSINYSIHLENILHKHAHTTQVEEDENMRIQPMKEEAIPAHTTHVTKHAEQHAHTTHVESHNMRTGAKKHAPSVHPPFRDPMTESNRVPSIYISAREQNMPQKLIPAPPLEQYKVYYKHRTHNGQVVYGPPYAAWQLDPNSTWGYLHFLEMHNEDESTVHKSEWLPKYELWCHKQREYPELREESHNGHYHATPQDPTVPLPVH